MLFRILSLLVVLSMFAFVTACSPQKEEPKVVPVSKDRMPPGVVKK